VVGQLDGRERICLLGETSGTMGTGRGTIGITISAPQHSGQRPYICGRVEPIAKTGNQTGKRDASGKRGQSAETDVVLVTDHHIGNYTFEMLKNAKISRSSKSTKN
jgi:hypothetical protein